MSHKRNEALRHVQHSMHHVIAAGEGSDRAPDSCKLCPYYRPDFKFRTCLYAHCPYKKQVNVFRSTPEKWDILIMKMMNKFCALMLSVALCAGMAAPAFAYGGEPTEEVGQPVQTSTTDEEDVVTVTDEESGALTPEGNLTLVDDYHTSYSDGSGQQFITLVSKSGATFYLVIDRNAKGQQTVHFMNLVDEADLLALMEEDAADAYTAEKEAAAQAEQDKLKAEEEAKKNAEEAAASGTEQLKENKVTKIASGFLGVVVLIALAAGGGYLYIKMKGVKPASKKNQPDPDADYHDEDEDTLQLPEDDGDEDEEVDVNEDYEAESDDEPV